MRITGGKYKNRRILTETKKTKNFKFRPTAEKTRLAIFNIIAHSAKINVTIENSIFADICCGSGSVGLEAISRGAAKVYFVDSEFEQVQLAKMNADLLNENENCVFINSNAQKLPLGLDCCNIIYIDPPYNSKLLNQTITSLQSNGWINEQSIVITECAKREIFDKKEGFDILDQRIYGNTKLIFLKILSQNK